MKNSASSRSYINKTQKILELFDYKRGLLIPTLIFTLILIAFYLIKLDNNYIFQALCYVIPIILALLPIGWLSFIKQLEIQRDIKYLDTSYDKRIGFPVKQGEGLSRWINKDGHRIETERLNEKYKTMYFLLLVPKILALLCLLAVNDIWVLEIVN